jgi:hypothetical protein
VLCIHLRKQMDAISYNTHCFARFASSARFALKSAQESPTTRNSRKTSVPLCELCASVINFKTSYCPVRRPQPTQQTTSPRPGIGIPGHRVADLPPSMLNLDRIHPSHCIQFTLHHLLSKFFFAPWIKPGTYRSSG